MQLQIAQDKALATVLEDVTASHNLQVLIAHNVLQIIQILLFVITVSIK